jgi:hypothetical protein
MKNAEVYTNRFPLEPLLPILDEKEVQTIVNDCDYTFESNRICEADKIDNKVNTADAVVFYQMGYEAARKVIESKLEPSKTI